MHTPVKGTVVAGRYRLEGLIGEGGMARVWRAKDQTLARNVAVKFLFVREDRDAQNMVDRFLREARIAAAVRHPNVVDILDFGTTEQGRPFMIMELLEGESVEERLSRDPALQLEQLLQCMSGALDGLQAVHKAGIVHRDLKPSNVFLLNEDGAEPRPKILDFGVSRETDPDSGRRSALTTTDGYLVGTPEYMSPEQARGVRDIDWRTDIYSMGVILYEGMAGRLPYQSEAVGDLIIEIVAGGAPHLFELRPEIGENIASVVMQAMAVRREDRFQSAREMRDALLEAAELSISRGAVRASMPVPHPMRHSRPSRGAGAAKMSTLDDGSLPWGAAAVPSLDATSRPPIDTPHSWSVETKLPGQRRPRRWPWAVAGLAALAPIGVGAWIALSPPPPVVPAAQAPPPVPAAQPPHEPLVERHVLPDAPSEVWVRLDGLPPDCEVQIDDVPAVVNAGVVRMPRDNAEHRIEVVAPNHNSFEVLHRASSDATYRVDLRMGRARPTHPNGRNHPPGEQPQQAQQAQQTQQQQTTAPGGIIRDIDY